MGTLLICLIIPGDIEEGILAAVIADETESPAIRVRRQGLVHNIEDDQWKNPVSLQDLHLSSLDGPVPGGRLAMPQK